MFQLILIGAAKLEPLIGLIVCARGGILCRATAKQVGSVVPSASGDQRQPQPPVTLSATPHACLSSAHLNCARLRKSHDFSLTCHQRSRGNSTVATTQVSGMQHQFVQHGRNFTHATEGQLTKTE